MAQPFADSKLKTSLINNSYSGASESKGAITSKIKHAIKHITSPARLAQLLQPSLAFCFSLQPIMAYHQGLDGTPSLAEAKTKC